jgi:hypothetical protein
MGGAVGWISAALDGDKMVSCCEDCDELLGFIKCGEFVDWMWHCSLLKLGSAALYSLKTWHRYTTTDHSRIYTLHH